MTLQVYLRLGLKISKIRRVLAFKQSLFLKQYIDKCTSLRQAATTDFGKRLFKLFANAVFGKFIEQARNYLNVSFASNKDQLVREISNLNFNNFKILAENLVAIFRKQRVVTLNKAFPIGFTILDRSKAFMYEQFYEHIKPKLGKCTVLLSDTDSLIMMVQNGKNQEQNMKLLRKLMDFSNYSPKSPLFSLKNANKLGYWKDELRGQEMTHFVGLKSKTYAYLLNRERKNVFSKCKGITKAYRKTLRFGMFTKCVKYITKKELVQYRIQAKNHIIHTLKMRKTAFTSFDDKRYIFKCGVHSAPYGSILIKRALQKKKCPFCPSHQK